MSPTTATVIIAFFVLIVVLVGSTIYVLMDPDRLRQRDYRRIEDAPNSVQAILMAAVTILKVFRASYWTFMITGLTVLGGLGMAANNWLLDPATVKAIVSDVLDFLRWLTKEIIRAVRPSATWA